MDFDFVALCEDYERREAGMTTPIVDHEFYHARMDVDGVFMIRDRDDKQVGGVLYDAVHAADTVEALNLGHAMRSTREWRREQDPDRVKVDGDHVRGKPNDN